MGIVQDLKQGKKIYLNASGNTIKDKILYGDNLIIVPLDSTVKAGDLVFCYVNRWLRLREVVKIENGKFTVSQERYNGNNIYEVEFKDVIGKCFEIVRIKRTDSNSERTVIRL